MAGFLSKLFGKGGSTKKYEEIFSSAHYGVKQSLEYSFQQAVDAAVADGVFATPVEAAAKLYDAVKPKVEAEDPKELPLLDKAKAKVK